MQKSYESCMDYKLIRESHLQKHLFMLTKVTSTQPASSHVRRETCMLNISYKPQCIQES